MCFIYIWIHVRNCGWERRTRLVSWEWMGYTCWMDRWMNWFRREEESGRRFWATLRALLRKVVSPETFRFGFAIGSFSYCIYKVLLFWMNEVNIYWRLISFREKPVCSLSRLFLRRASAVLGINMDVQRSTPENAKHAPPSIYPCIHPSHIYKLLRSFLGESMVICLLRMCVRAVVPGRLRSPITTRN